MFWLGFAVLSILADTILTLQFWHFEMNQVVIFMGQTHFIVIKAGLIAAAIIVYADQRNVWTADVWAFLLGGIHLLAVISNLWVIL